MFPNCLMECQAFFCLAGGFNMSELVSTIEGASSAFVTHPTATQIYGNVAWWENEVIRLDFFNFPTKTNLRHILSEHCSLGFSIDVTCHCRVHEVNSVKSWELGHFLFNLCVVLGGQIYEVWINIRFNIIQKNSKVHLRMPIDFR
jgi:hypothetical protein